MIKILYQGDSGQFNQLRAAFNSENVQIENRSLSTKTPGSAGILTDYDILAFDLAIPIRLHPIYAQKILAFLNEKRGMLLFILRQYIKDEYRPPNEKSIIIDNHELLKFLLLNAGFDNDGFQFEPNPSYMLSISSQGKNSVIRKYLEDDKYNIDVMIPKGMELPIQPLALDNEENTVAFSIKPYTGQVFIVPPKAGNELIELIEYVLPMVGESQSELVDVPEWVYSYTIPGLEEINKTIIKTDEKIEKLDRIKETSEIQQRKLENIRNVLLFGKHDILDDTVFSVLMEIGFKSIKGPEGAHDIEFTFDKNLFVCEVKGRDKSINKQDIRQLVDWKDQTENEKEVKVKGILIANPWRKLPLEERDTNDNPNFPDSINKLVKLKELCLVTTPQIFAIYCQWKENPKSINIKEIIEEMHSTTGFYSKYTDLKKVEKVNK